MEQRDGISPHNIVDAQLADYVAGDAERFASHYAIDSVCVRLPEGELIASGRSEIARVWGALFARRTARVTIIKRTILGDVVVDHERVTNNETGHTIEALASYFVQDGLIQRVWFLGPAITVREADQ